MSHACHCFWKATKPSRFAHFWQGAQSQGPATQNHIWNSKSCPSMWCFYVFLTFWLGNVLRATMACTFSTPQLPKVLRTQCALYILTSTCALRHNGVQIFSTSQLRKMLPTCSVLYMLTSTCASRHNGVHHLNFQTWSETVSFLHFWLLRATGAWSFSSPISPDGSAPAALASLLFDPPEPQITEKHSVSRLCYLFARLHLLSSVSSDSFSSLIFVLLLFSSLSLPTSAFSSVHIVGRLTSKLTSIIISDSFGGPVIFSPSFPDARNSFRNFWLEKSWSLWMTPVRHAWRRSYDLCLMWSKL